MAIWPALLPCKPLKDSFSRTNAPNTVATPNDVGQPIMRRRFTGRTIIETGTLVLTKAQAQILDEFWATTVAQGSLEFLKAAWFDGSLQDHSFLPDSQPNFTITAGRFFCPLSLQYTLT